MTERVEQESKRVYIETYGCPIKVRKDSYTSLDVEFPLVLCSPTSYYS